MTAEEKWAADSKKINLIKKAGYEVLVIWESEYHKDPELTLKKCIDFLND
jgi:G:T-mismatch repair DNA endonuclease (very short patch repair protein)